MCRKPLVFMKGVLPNNASARAQCSRHTNIFPNVNKLILTRAGYENGYDVDDEFWSQIEDWPISYLDLSFVRANVLNLTSFFRRCKHLRTIKMKGIYVATLTYKHTDQPICQFETVDMSSLTVPVNIFSLLKQFLLMIKRYIWSGLTCWQVLKKLFWMTCVQWQDQNITCDILET